MSDRIRALVALAVDNPTSEEARTAAVKACQEIVKSGVLARLGSVAAPALRRDSYDIPPEVQEILRKQAEERAVYEAVERRERESRTVEGRAWHKRIAYGRTWCRACRRIVEDGEVYFTSAGVDRCLACDAQAEAIARDAEAAEPPVVRTKKSRKPRKPEPAAAEPGLGAREGGNPSPEG